MSHTRKVDTYLWNDAQFNALSVEGKLVFLFLLTHPHLTVLGAMRATFAGLARELNLSLACLKAVLEEAYLKKHVYWDERAAFIWLPYFLDSHVPQSPNVVKSWQTIWEQLPTCSLKMQLRVHLQAFIKTLAPSFQAATPPCFQTNEENYYDLLY